MGSIQRLVNCESGLSPEAVRQLYKSDLRAEIWWNGPKKCQQTGNNSEFCHAEDIRSLPGHLNSNTSNRSSTPTGRHTPAPCPTEICHPYSENARKPPDQTTIPNQLPSQPLVRPRSHPGGEEMEELERHLTQQQTIQHSAHQNPFLPQRIDRRWIRCRTVFTGRLPPHTHGPKPIQNG